MAAVVDNTRVPFLVPRLNPLVQRLLRIGLPLGPNALLTVRGRKSGAQRTTPVAVVELQGGRWVIGTFGEVNWVRNLRAAGEGIVAIKGKPEYVRVVELTQEQAIHFFSGVIAPYVRASAIRRVLLGLLGAKDILSDPAKAARERPVFELRRDLD